jgi:aerobic-type carbon monoxide dehydrogenase small subunit (CoxS/CutS family)
VLVDGEPVCSCLLFAGQIAGCHVETVANFTEDRLVGAITEAAGVQCGFCTPGIILSARSLLDQNPRPTRHEVQVALSGNLCRCTGYYRILDAVEAAAGERR